MKHYCIKFFRLYDDDDDNVEHNFYCFALKESEAIERFCKTTGYESSCVISVHLMGD